MLIIDHLTKTYGKTRAVDDLCLHIAPGEICGFIGHNGAGKTTAIKACCGILPFDSGEIRINGLSVQKDPLACKRLLAYVPDNPDLYEFLTGMKYLNFIADVYAVDSQEREKQIRRLAEMFGIYEALGQNIGAYSHGMKQKLALTAALMHRPKLLVLDEPFVGLDPKASHLLKQEMRLLCEEGSSIFFSTHVLEVAEKLCDTVAIISHGKLLRYGPTEQVRGDESLEEVFLTLAEEGKADV
ncbi:MAG: ABC transporter ATP-binding protein [Clostridia bacterium]|nr:ABC transporter ATP-binding protein [Clostridia bacterium]